MGSPYFIGVDVGTGSARAGLFDSAGALLTSQKHDIKMWRETGDIAEQSSDDIWAAVCLCLRECVSQSGISPTQIRGIGFDAACSLVVLDRQIRPLTVSQSGANERNVIVWMDQRAKSQADHINSLGHRVLEYVGGRISPEMQTPKLLWLRQNLPETFAAAGHYFDLCDFLTWRATGSLARSQCTVTCKWTYLAPEERWDDDYFNAIGLDTLVEGRYAAIGQEIKAPGAALSAGLTAEAASETGLPIGLPVGAGLIDAHAGGVGTVGADPELGAEKTMAYVFGTSACTMTSSQSATYIPGVWGPYFSAMVPGLWLAEGGQSAAGEAIAHLVERHPAAEAARQRAEDAGLTLQDHLLHQVGQRASSWSDAYTLAGHRIIVPDFLGNRAPFADPYATAIVSGLTLNTDEEDLLATYVAAILGVGYGLRQILDVQKAHGLNTEAVVISGGAGENDIIRQLLADTSGRSVLATSCAEPVLLGAAMLGAVASGTHPDLTSAMGVMSSISARYEPAKGPIAEAHDARYRAYCALQKADRDLRQSSAQM